MKAGLNAWYPSYPRCTGLRVFSCVLDDEMVIVFMTRMFLQGNNPNIQTLPIQIHRCLIFLRRKDMRSPLVVRYGFTVFFCMMACFRRVAGIQWNQAVFVQAKRWRNMNVLRCWPEANAAIFMLITLSGSRGRNTAYRLCNVSLSSRLLYPNSQPVLLPDRFLQQ